MEFSKIRSIIFFSTLVLVTGLFLYLFRPFFYPIFWAAVIASIFHPLYKRIAKAIKMPRLAAVTIMVLVLLIIVLPLIGISSLLVKEAVDLYGALDNSSSQINQNAVSVFHWIQNHPLAQQLNIQQSFWVEKFTEFTRAVTSYILINLKSITQSSFVFLVMFVLMFYTLYYFLLDGAKFLKLTMHLCPLGDKHEKVLYNKFTSTALATLKSSLLIGGIQGILSGLLFYALGVQGAAIWGLLTVALCILPVGSGVVWLPMGIIMLITGNIWQGIVIILAGTLVISTIDNLLRPIMIGKQTQLHPLMVLFTTLGGITFFGITGFVIGPIIASLVVALWEMYDNYYKDDLDQDA